MTSDSFLVDPWTYNYYNSHWTDRVDAESEADIKPHKGVHTTDVTHQKALAMIDQAAKAGGQFYMQVATGETVE